MAKKHKEENIVNLFDSYEIDEPIRKNNKEIKEEPKTKDALELARENYKEYGIYVGSGRAYPQLLDGAKSSYKRAIYGMWKDAPRRVAKVAELAATALPYHPHPTSVANVIIQLGENGNKFKFMHTQGNWGDSSKKIAASAERYIGGMLSDTAIMLLCDSIEYCNFITGEIDKPEPEALPTLLPICFINGQQGIPSGLPKLNIPPLDVANMFDYYIDILEHKNLNYVPNKLPIPNLNVNILSTKEEWENILKTGNGSIRIAPIMKFEDNIITITNLPKSKDVESIRKIIEKEILLDKVDLRDESTYDTRVVIEKVYKKQCDMKELYNRIYKKLQTTETYNLAFFDINHIYVPCSFDKVVKSNLKYLIDTHNSRLSHQLIDNNKKLSVLEIIEQLKKKNNWKDMFDLSFKDAINYLINNFNCDKEIAEEVFKKPISYLTKGHEKEIEELRNIIKNLNTDKHDIYDMLLKKYKALKPKMLKEMNKNTTSFIKINKTLKK
ncbi:MAG: hypothetical protein M0Q88_00815 [Bacilli bacterium]|nr:hypothetical protein [Bacilli bacterium]